MDKIYLPLVTIKKWTKYVKQWFLRLGHQSAKDSSNLKRWGEEEGKVSPMIAPALLSS